MGRPIRERFVTKYTQYTDRGNKQLLSSFKPLKIIEENSKIIQQTIQYIGNQKVSTITIETPKKLPKCR
ncbi:hypothetical protein AB432_026810 [Brevibacillus brevis]|uniref:Uncharacterized protein n=1 Tax=Brevibacillus brevis TaxID=1393 RepID=A0A2Z4MQW7_BREBE|nr:hypothetical protein AB432_026810 [Brevibacillus brevis]RAT98480.1 hypothetical protein ASG16_007230 [Brevibacillus sp. Leaf182]